MNNPVTLVTAKTIKLLLCVRARTREKHDYRTFYTFPSYYCDDEQRAVVLWKVTCRFMESDVSFYEKWRVVLQAVFEH